MYSTYYELLISLGIEVWHVLTRDHTVLPATHMFIHTWNETYLLLTPAIECYQCTTPWLVLISRLSEGRRLSWQYNAEMAPQIHFYFGEF